MYYEISGKGVPLLFIHGLGASGQDWENQVAYFAKKFKVITIDLRGHGRSNKPKGPYSIKLFADDTAQFIQCLGYGPIHVVGHSLGGMVAFQLALDYPQLIKTLTIVNSAPSFSFISFRQLFGFALRKMSVRIFGMFFLSRSLAKNLFPKMEQKDLRKLFIARWRQNKRRAYIASLHAFRDWNVLLKIPSIHMPTCIITADEDYTPVSYKEAYARLIPRSELKVIDDSRHMTILDQPQKFNVALDSFLSKHKPK